MCLGKTLTSHFDLNYEGRTLLCKITRALHTCQLSGVSVGECWYVTGSGGASLKISTASLCTFISSSGMIYFRPQFYCDYIWRFSHCLCDFHELAVTHWCCLLAFKLMVESKLVHYETYSAQPDNSLHYFFLYYMPLTMKSNTQSCFVQLLAHCLNLLALCEPTNTT